MPTDLELNPRSLLHGTKVGEYTIESPINEGGQGVLYRVSRGSNVFTLKVATGRRAQTPESDQVEIDGRLRREFATLLVIKHPNVVRAISFDWWPEVETGYPFFVMEHVAGDPALRWQQKTHPPLRAICRVLLQAAGALRALHEHGIIHRDLKSDNLLVREDGAPVIVDFGLAWQRSAWTLTTFSNVLGTRTHLSPDYCRHFRDHAEDEERYVFQPTDDTHALGYIFYEMLVGRAPFDPEEFEQEYELMRAIGTRVPKRPRELNPKVPPALDEIVMALLEKEGARRMDAPKLVAVLEKALSEADAEWDAPFDTRNAPPPPPGEEPEAAREAPEEEIPRATRKRSVLAATGVLAIAALAALFVWGAFHRKHAAPTAAPQPPTAEQGKPTMNDETNPNAPTSVPAVAKTAPKASTRTAGARSCHMLLKAIAVAALSACTHVKTGTKAGDCSFAPVREVLAPNPSYAEEKHLLLPGSKLRIPPVMNVEVSVSNPGGACQKQGVDGDAPVLCPAYEGPIVLRLGFDDYVDYPTWWVDPKTRKETLLLGQTHIFDDKGTWKQMRYNLEIQDYEAKVYDLSGRMTAVITQLQTPDGTLWPVCGVLFGDENTEGVPILASNKSQGIFTRARVRFYWPAP